MSVIVSDEFAATVILFNALAKEVEALGGLSMTERCALLRNIPDVESETGALLRFAADALDPATDRPALTVIKGGRADPDSAS